MTLKKLTKVTFNDAIQGEQPVIVIFGASWCKPCLELTRVLADLAAQQPQSKIYKVDTDDSPSLKKRFKIKGIPVVMVFKNAQEVTRDTGFGAAVYTLKFLKPYLNKESK
jgi:thioredoxin 1